MQTNQDYTNAQGTQAPPLWGNKDPFSTSGASFAVSIQKPPECLPQTQYSYPFPPPTLLPPPLPSNLPPPALSSTPPPGDLPLPLPPKPKIYQQQALYQHPSLATVEGTPTSAPYASTSPCVPVYCNPPSSTASFQQPPLLAPPSSVPPAPVHAQGSTQSPNFAPGYNQAIHLQFKCNASKQHPYSGGHAMYDMRGNMVYDAQVCPGGKGRDHVVVDYMRREVLRAHFQTTALRVEFHINTPEGPKVALYSRHKMRSAKQIDLDGITYVQKTEKVGNHLLFHPKIYKWGPEGAPEVAMRAGNDFFVYPTCPKALEIALVFAIAHLCHTKDIQVML